MDGGDWRVALKETDLNGSTQFKANWSKMELDEILFIPLAISISRKAKSL